MKEFYSIGEMAKLNFISPHTLRYYDKIDLLKPSHINKETGYRYYSYKDFLFLDAIQYLRHFDMSLEEIKEQFDNRTVEGTLELYEKQLVKLHENIEALKNIEKRIVHNIDNLKKSSNSEFSDEIQVVDLEERYALIVDDTVENDDEYEVKIRSLSNALYNNHFQHMGDYIGIKDREAVIRGNYSTTKHIGNMCIGKPSYASVKIIPAGRYVRTCYTGRTEGIDGTYDRLMEYIKQRNFAINGEIIETYAIDYIDTKRAEEYVTIIEIPVSGII
ncbi:MAG: MerR family transcriptional regulator [Firmicutes bacterium]|nr:MerR family transcriptional regulator [Bacillota bacterium]